MTVYRLYVFLPNISPPIWRRIELSSEDSLAQLHELLQIAMGWDGYHLHEFEIRGQRYGVPEAEFDLPRAVIKASTVKVSTALPRVGESLLYTYDFGDVWAHAVVLEDIPPAEQQAKYPRIVDGARACPPEDAGGPRGYTRLIDILAKPKHKQHSQMRERVGKSFDIERFSIKAANLLLKQTMPTTSTQSIETVQ